MSKMSQLYAELTEQAAQLGFHSVEEAEINGYKVDYEKQELVPDAELEQEKAHEAWLKERDEVLGSIDNAIYHNLKLNNDKETYEQIVLRRARDFIKEQCHD